MKKIIDGRRYDTETATLIDDTESGCGRSDFHYFRESLYRTKSGAFFLAGEGGPLSHYSQPVDQNSWSGGSRIRPLEHGEALAWLERHSTAETIEEIFKEEILDA